MKKPRLTHEQRLAIGKEMHEREENNMTLADMMAKYNVGDNVLYVAQQKYRESIGLPKKVQFSRKTPDPSMKSKKQLIAGIHEDLVRRLHKDGSPPEQGWTEQDARAVEVLHLRELVEKYEKEIGTLQKIIMVLGERL